MPAEASRDRLLGSSMSPSTEPQTIHRLVQLSADLCEENRTRCAHQLGYLYDQQQALVVQRQKRYERRVAEIAELWAVCEFDGLGTHSDVLTQRIKMGPGWGPYVLICGQT